MRIAVTGHRPDSLYGYDMKDLRWIDLEEKFERILVVQNCTEAITGMALGVDQVFAQAVINLRDRGVDIKLTCVIPCRYQEKMWPESSKLAYYMILNEADKVIWSSIMEYDKKCMQKRNRYMVDRADKLIAVWNGSYGTGHCVRCAEQKGIEIIRVDI